MGITNEKQKSSDITLMSSHQKGFNITVSIYMSKEVAERLIAILMTLILGLPISFFTAWYVSKQAFSSLSFDKYYESPNSKYDVN